MFAIVKTKSADYFSNCTPPFDIYDKTKTYKERRTFFTFFIAHYLKEPLKIVELITNLIDKKSFEDDSFLSIIWAISLQLSNQNTQLTQLADLVKLINSKSLIQKSKLLQNLPQNLIDKSGLMQQQQIDKKFGRTYTKTYFEQNKFSLIKENNEGFSKLLLFLANLSDNLPNDQVWNKILSLVGKFDLDPDRVLDLIIESQLLNPSKTIYTNLIQKFKGQSITVILSNRLAKIPEKKCKSLVFAGYFQNFSNTTIQEIYRKHGQIPNPSLIRLIADLSSTGVIQVQQISKHLQPSNIVLEQINYKRIKQGQERVMKAFKISLQELDQAQKNAVFNEDNLKFYGQLLFSTKLALYTEFVRLNEWKIFEKLWSSHKNSFDLMLYQPLLKELLNLIEWSIQPIYSQISFGRFMKNVVKKQNFQQKQNGIKKSNTVNSIFFQQLLFLLEYVKDYLGFSHSLLTKLCRIFKRIQNSALKFNQGQNVQFCSNSIKYIIKNYMVPGINYQLTNPALGNEVFSLLELYPYQFRYECYLEVYKNKLNHNPYMAKAFQHYKIKQNIIVNNLSNNNKKQFGKKLAKLTHNHALQVMYWIARRLLKEDYEAIVPQIISALSNSTRLTLEQTIFLMIFYLNENRQPAVKMKIAQFQPWFKNITMFVSLFYRKYLEVDLQPIFDFFMMKTSQQIRELQDNQQMPGAYIKLLHELLNKMLGSFIIEDINKAKYEILSAGPRLQIELLYLTSEIRAAKKSKHTLQEFFWDKTSSHFQNNTLAFNLLVLLCQKRAQFMQRTYIQNLKIVGDTYDDFTTLIIQLVRVLTYQATDFTRYSELLPQNPIDALINKYKIPVEIAFQIVRPGIKHISKMNDEEWNGLKSQVQIATTKFIENKDYFKLGYCNDSVADLFTKSRSNLSELLPTGIFTSFWFLTLDSIYFPDKLYAQKIQDLRKKIDPLQLKKGEKSDSRQVEKNKTLYEKIKKQEQIQRQKCTSTLTPQNLKKLEIPYFKTSTSGNMLINFAQAFVQFCLLPRLLLDPRQAIYCMKFTIVMIKANKMSSSKSIKMLTYIIEFVMNYLPFSTKREAQNCLATFLSQILGIFINWNEPAKLKQDMKFYLEIEDLKDNYQKLRQFLLRLFERVGNLIKSIVEEPYVIKNCLYLLEKVDAIPGYKEQAEQLENHMKQLRQIHSSVDMKTILDMQIAILGAKKAKLSGKPQDKNSLSLQNIAQPTNKVQIQPKSAQVVNGKPEVYIALQKEKQRRDQRDRLSKDRQRERISKERQKSYQKDSKDRQRQKGRDSKDREKLKEIKQSKDRFQRQRISKDRQRQKEKEKQLKAKQQKLLKQKQEQKQRIKEQREKKQLKDKQEKQRNAQKQIYRQKINVDKQRFDNYKQNKKLQQPPKIIEKRVIKGQQKPISRPNISTDTSSQPRQTKQFVNQKNTKQVIDISNRFTNKQIDIEAIKPSTMTVKQMRQRKAAEQSYASQSDAIPSRTIFNQTQQIMNQAPTQQMKTQIKSQTQVQSKNERNFTNFKSFEQDSKIKKKSQPQTTQQMITQKETQTLNQSEERIHQTNQSKVISQTQKKVSNQIVIPPHQSKVNGDNHNQKDKDLYRQQKMESTQIPTDKQVNKPKKEIYSQEINIGPKEQILQRMEQSNFNKDNLLKTSPQQNIQKSLNKIIHQQNHQSQDSKDKDKEQNLAPKILKQQEIPSTSKLDQKVRNYDKDKSPHRDYKHRDKKQRDQNQILRQEKFKGERGHSKETQKEQRQQDSKYKDSKQDKYTHHSKDNYRDSRDRSEYRRDRETQRGHYQSKNNRDKDYRYNKEKQERRDRQDKKEERRQKQDRRSKDNNRQDKGKYVQKDRQRERKNDYDKDRKGDQRKHNRSRSRNKHSHSRR